MGQILVVQLHVADGVGIGNLTGFGMGRAVRVRHGIRFRAVSGFRLHGLRQLVFF